MTELSSAHEIISILRNRLETRCVIRYLLHNSGDGKHLHLSVHALSLTRGKEERKGEGVLLYLTSGPRYNTKFTFEIAVYKENLLDDALEDILQKWWTGEGFSTVGKHWNDHREFVGVACGLRNGTVPIPRAHPGCVFYAGLLAGELLGHAKHLYAQPHSSEESKVYGEAVMRLATQFDKFVRDSFEEQRADFTYERLK